MRFVFELFGFYVNKYEKVWSFWMLSITFQDRRDGMEPPSKERGLFLIGRRKGKWMLELFFVDILGNAD